MIFWRVYIFALCGLLAWCAAHAAPPPGITPDPAIAAWYRSLKDRHGVSCCDEADCRPVRYRSVPVPPGASADEHSGVEVFIDRASYGPAAPDAWVPVPPRAMLTRDNPTGSAVACYYAGRVACFVRGFEG